MTFCLFLFYILFPNKNNLVAKIVFPGKQGIYLENGIRPLFPAILQIEQVLFEGFLNGLE